MTNLPREDASPLGRARALRREGRAAEAAELLQSVLRQDPGNAGAHLEWGNLLKSQGRYADAVAPLKEAARLAPGQAAAWLNLGVALLELSRLEEATLAFEEAVRLEPRRAEALNILGHTWLERGEQARAAQLFERAVKLQPRYAAAWDNLGRVRKAQGRAADALSLHRRALAAGADAATGSNLLYTLNLVPDLSPADIFAEHERWGAAQPGPPEPFRPFAEHRRLRVGYVSPDFCHHAVAHFIEPILAHHDRDRCEVFGYSDVRRPDAVTARLRGLVEHWRDLSPLKDDAAWAAIRRDEIDVLFDLAGHTGRNRLGVFARRAAPIQASWIGYPNTTGLRAMDYRLTDAVADPPGLTEAWHTERLVRLPGPFCCYRPPQEAPAVAPPPAARPGVTFGCFNHLAKLNPRVIGAWARLLERVPDATLLLKTRGIDEPTRRSLLAGFAEQGADPLRVEVISDSLSVRDHLALYGRVDLALDVFPYNGTTTTCEALWMGVPVVTLAGQTHVSRTGASLLTHAGLPEMVASSSDEYVHLAAGLAADRPRLASLRTSLRERVQASPLRDEMGFVRGLEKVLFGLAPASE